MKFGIGAKMALLLSALVSLTGWLLMDHLGDAASALVMEHELGDLNDETSLRAREIQSQLYAVRRDVGLLAKEDAMQTTLASSGEVDVKPAAEACETYFQKPAMSSYLRFEVWLIEEGNIDSAKRIAPPESQQRSAAMPEVAQVIKHLPRAQPNEPYLSDILTRAIEVQRGKERVVRTTPLIWCGVRVTAKKSDEDTAQPKERELLVLGLVDLGATLPDGHLSPLEAMMGSPRHLTYIANDPEAPGNQLDTALMASHIEPLDPTKSAYLNPAPLVKSFQLLYEEREGLNDLDNAVQTLLPKRGVVADRDLPLEKPLVFQQTRSILNRNERELISNRLMVFTPELTESIPGLRISNLQGTVSNLRLLANRREDLDVARQKINEFLAKPAENFPGAKLTWDGMVDCRHCQFHFVLFPVRSELSSHHQRFYGLAQCAFTEEMKAGVENELHNLRAPALLVVCCVALVGFVAAIVFTRPIKQMTAAAKAVGDINCDLGPDSASWQAEVDKVAATLPVRRQDEIGVLARAFQDMIDDVSNGRIKLQLMNSELDKRVQERTLALEEANTELKVARDKAEDLSRAKSAFLASVSHELRNPLNQVSGFCQLLELSPLDDEQRADLKKIQLAGSQLLALVNDILDYQKIVMGGVQLEPEEIKVCELLSEVGDAMKFAAEENGNHVKVECSGDAGTLLADKQRVRQILLNLTGNACKFTQNGTVTIRAVRKTEGGVDRVVFDVADSGRGMTAEEQARLFTPFTRLASRQGNRTGTGLGLVISKGFLELMGGDISLVSEFGRGSTFTVRIPAGVTAPAPAGLVTSATAAAGPDGHPAPASPPARRESRTVLVIEDDEDARELMERYLGGQGFQVISAATGIEGLKMARELKPAVITLDAVMPGLDGWAVLAALKADEQTAGIPVVMVTILDQQQRGQVMGASDFIVKPIHWERLSQVLARLAGHQHDRSVLIVDDEAPTREIMRRHLQTDGWRVIEAEHGAEALEVLAHQRPSVILLDLMMPTMNGFEFLDELAKFPEWLSIPIIVVTAKDPTPDEMERLNRMTVQLLQKGRSSQAELLDAIHRRVNRHLQESI